MLKAYLHPICTPKWGQLATLAVGLTIIVFLLGMERFLPKVPAPLLAAAAAIAGVYLLNLQDRGVELVGHNDVFGVL